MRKTLTTTIILMASLLLVSGPAFSIDKSELLGLLNWENANLSFSSDLASKTVTQGKVIKRKSKIYKLGRSLLRIDTEPSMLKAYNRSNSQMGNFYIIKKADSKKAYMVFPDKKAYVEADTDEIKKALKNVGEQLEDKAGNRQKIKSFERLGETSIEGIACEKVHAITVDKNGTTFDITAWLAGSYNYFPLKTIIKSTMPTGQQVENTMLFHNIKRKAPAKSLFEIPSGYREYKNLVQLQTNGKAGTGIEAMKKRWKKKH